MTRHGRRIQRSGRTGALALLVVLPACAAPARALAWDAPLEPVSFAAAVPTSTASPVASGPLVRGSVVSVTTGAWTDAPTTYTYVWQRDMGAGYTTIPGAAAATYTLAGADVSANVRALVTARNATGPSAPSASNALGPVAGAPPVNSAAPSVSGTPGRGSVLTAAPGTWAGVSNVYTYQWQRDDGTGFADITAAKTATYTLTTADEDALVRVLVRAVNVDGSVTLPSNEVGPIAATPPISSAVPAVTGTVKRGLTLTTNAGSWSGVGNTYAYQWQRNTGSGFADIAGATRNTYVLVTADTGALIRSKITATNPDGAASAYSLATGPVDAAAPVNTAAPTITGSARRTSVMTAAIGTWTGAGNTYAFQWQRDPGNGFADIPGATTANYTLTTADLGATVRIEVTATNADGSVVAVSAASDPVTASPPVQGAAPVVSGTPRTGQSLATTPGTWTPAGSTFTYQWQRDTGSGFADIAGATAATYALTSADAGAKVRSRVVASNADGATANFSSAVGPVIPTPVNTAAPTVTGTLTDASTLTVSPGTWDSAGRRRGRLQVPVGPLPHLRERCRLRGLRRPARGDGRHLHDGRGRRRFHAGRARDRDQQRQRLRRRGLGGHRHGRRPRADQRGPAGDHGHGRCPLGPDGGRRHVERPVDQGHVPVAALLVQRRRVRRHPGRGR